jgi:hypothetical protein
MYGIFHHSCTQDAHPSPFPIPKAPSLGGATALAVSNKAAANHDPNARSEQKQKKKIASR